MRRHTKGWAIQDQLVLSFRLAARSQSILMRTMAQQAEKVVGRAMFAEGLASSYDAFLKTGKLSVGKGDSELVDEDATNQVEVVGELGRDRALKW